MNPIKILDILASVLTVVSLYMVTKNYKWWLVYTVASVCFTVVMLANKIPGLTIMGICLFITGINNYRIGRKNA